MKGGYPSLLSIERFSFDSRHYSTIIREIVISFVSNNLSVI